MNDGTFMLRAERGKVKARPRVTGEAAGPKGDRPGRMSACPRVPGIDRLTRLLDAESALPLGGASGRRSISSIQTDPDTGGPQCTVRSPVIGTKWSTSAPVT